MGESRERVCSGRSVGVSQDNLSQDGDSQDTQVQANPSQDATPQATPPQTDIPQECSVLDPTIFAPPFGEVCEPINECISALNNLSAETAQAKVSSGPNFKADIKMKPIKDVSEKMLFTNRKNNGNTENLNYIRNTLKLTNYRSSNLSETEKKIKNGTLKQLDNENLYYRIDLGEIPEKARRSLLPHTVGLLKTISDKVNDLMHKNGLPNKYRVRMHIGSAYRTRESQKKTANTNVNASKDSRGSAHEYGNTFDIQYTKLDIVEIESGRSGKYSYQEIRGGNILTAYQGALSQVLNQMDLEKPKGKEKKYPRGLINVVKENQTPVYHISDNGVWGR